MDDIKEQIKDFGKMKLSELTVDELKDRLMDSVEPITDAAEDMIETAPGILSRWDRAIWIIAAAEVAEVVVLLFW
jgi:hypothetical protein